MNATGVGFADAPIWELWRHDQTAEFYFSAKTSKALSDFVEEALKNKDMHRAWNEDRFALERREQVNATTDHMEQLRERFKTLNAAMRQELKIAHDGDMSS